MTLHFEAAYSVLRVSRAISFFVIHRKVGQNIITIWLTREITTFQRVVPGLTILSVSPWRQYVIPFLYANFSPEPAGNIYVNLIRNYRKITRIKYTRKYRECVQKTNPPPPPLLSHIVIRRYSISLYSYFSFIYFVQDTCICFPLHHYSRIAARATRIVRTKVKHVNWPFYGAARRRPCSA